MDKLDKLWWRDGNFVVVEGLDGGGVVFVEGYVDVLIDSD